MLSNLEHGGKEVNPVKLEKSKLMKALKRASPGVTWDKILLTVDRALDLAIFNGETSAGTNLVWCCTGSLLGHSSPAPHADMTYLHDKISKLAGGGRLSTMTAGVLVQWRIANRAAEMHEEWYCSKVDTNTWDEELQGYVYYYQYWRAKAAQ